MVSDAGCWKWGQDRMQVIGARSGLEDVNERSQRWVEDLTWIQSREAAHTVLAWEGVSVAPAGCREQGLDRVWVNNWCKTSGLRDVIPWSQSQVEDLTLIREESLSEDGCRDEYHTVYESDWSSKGTSELTLVVAHDVNHQMTGDAQGVNLTLEMVDGMRLREGWERKREKMNESLRATERQRCTKAL